MPFIGRPLSLERPYIFTKLPTVVGIVRLLFVCDAFAAMGVIEMIFSFIEFMIYGAHLRQPEIVRIEKYTCRI